MEDKFKYENYSSEDGALLDKLEVKKHMLQKINEDTCITCNYHNKENSNYCSSCGNSLIKTNNNLYEGKFKNKKINLEHINLNNVVKASFLSVVILFIASLLIKGILNIEFIENKGLINIIYIMMGLNLGYIDTSYGSMLGVENTINHIGIVGFMIIPIICILISNKIFIKNEDSKEVVYNSLGVGIIYSTILCVLSVLTKVGVNYNDYTGYSSYIETMYRPTSIFINSFIIAFLVSFFINFKKKHEKENSYLGILKKSIKVILISYILVFIVVGIITISNRSYLYEFGINSYIKDMNILLVILQLSMYMLAFANFISVTISQYLLSGFNILSSSLFLETKIIFIIVILLLSLIMIINGCSLKAKYKDESFNPVFRFSINYAILMGALGLFSSIIIASDSSLMNMANNQGYLYLGFSTMDAMIVGFIYSFILNTIGYKLYSFE